MNQQEVKELILFAALCGRVMLENGAETYRVEETMDRIMNARGIDNIQSFVIPTGIFLSVQFEEQLMTHIERIYHISIDLMRVTRVNELSRDFVSSDMSLVDARQTLNSIKNSSQYSFLSRTLFTGMACSFLALVFKGGLSEFVGALITSIAVAVFMECLGRADVPIFIKSILGGIASAATTILFAMVATTMNIDTSVDIIIIGCTMQLVPGVAITNAVRDSISGDYVSGMSRTTEAIIVGLGIAFGVGIVMNAAIYFIGGIR